MRRGAQSGIDMHSLRTRVLAASKSLRASYEGLPPLSQDGTEICDIGADTDSMIPRTRFNWPKHWITPVPCFSAQFVNHPLRRDDNDPSASDHFSSDGSLPCP